MSFRFDIGTLAQPFWIGTQNTLTFTMSNSNGVPLPTNVVGWTMLFTIKRQIGGSFPVVFQTTPTTTDSANGVWQVAMTRAQTELLTQQGTYWYSLERIDVGFEDVKSYGQINAVLKVTG
jgi:hypothetical protein